MRPILTAESVTELGPAVRGAVLVAGSHGGVIACYLGATAGAHAMILNDAGIGLDAAGIAGLKWLEATGMAVATVAHTSARIGDGADSLARGVISHANACAAAAGVHPGQRASDAALMLTRAPAAHAPPPPLTEGRWQVGMAGETEVWALDSVGKLVTADAGRILVIGSHGALHGGRVESALNLHGAPIAARAAVFNDAGGGAGTTRLPALDARGIAAVTVSHTSARIGDGRSMWETGVISAVNEHARVCGAAKGSRLAGWIDLTVIPPFPSLR